MPTMPFAATEMHVLREQIRRIEAGSRVSCGFLPFGVPEIDDRLPGGQILWCLSRCDLFAPAMALAGLNPGRVIYAEAGSEKAILACFEESLRHGGLAGVVAEVARLPMTPSRRLQLAAESTRTIGIAIRRWRRQTEAADFGQPTASTTRWRVTALPSSPLPVPGVGRLRWQVELIRARTGECADFEVESCDEEGRITIPAKLVHRPAAAGSVRTKRNFSCRMDWETNFIAAAGQTPEIVRPEKSGTSMCQTCTSTP